MRMEGGRGWICVVGVVGVCEAVVGVGVDGVVVADDDGVVGGVALHVVCVRERLSVNLTYVVGSEIIDLLAFAASFVRRAVSSFQITQGCPLNHRNTKLKPVCYKRVMLTFNSLIRCIFAIEIKW